MDDYQIETRRRSRSKTPFLRSSCDHETCDHAGEEGHTHHQQQKKKVPNVQTIAEETVEAPASISPTKQTQKSKTSDYSSEDTSPESKSKKTSMNINEESLQKSKQMSSSTNRTSTSTTTSTTVVTKRKRVAASTPKAIANYLQESFASQFTGGVGVDSAAQSFREIAQNALNSESERAQRRVDTAGSNSSSFNKSYSNILNSSNGDLSDHIAYLEYKRAGEYWNTTPKTDYTYSKHSSFRRELAPGIVAMPNMSRSGLRTHNERVGYMINKLSYESGDEIDYQLDGYRKRQYNRYMQEQQQSWYMRIITTIVTTITSAWSAVAGDGGAEGVGAATGYDSSLYRTKYGQEERGFFGAIAHGISSAILQVFRYVYLLISSLLYLDTWLLQSSNADSKGRKRFLLLLLILLPLLLLGGLYHYLDYPTIPQLSELSFTLPSLPDFSKFDMSEYFQEDKIAALKEQTYKRLEDFRDWSDDYIMYLRTVSSNIADEGRKLFQREEHFERV